MGTTIIVSWNVNLNHVDCVSCIEEGRQIPPNFFALERGKHVLSCCSGWFLMEGNHGNLMNFRVKLKEYEIENCFSRYLGSLVRN